MKHVITFEESDIIQYIKDMLAMRGVAPEGEIKIIPVEEQAGQDAGGDMITVTRYQVNVTCRERDLLTHCPMCHHSLVDEKVVAVSASTSVSTQVEKTAAVEPEVEEPAGPPVILDEELGESLEPPEPPTKTGGHRGEDAGPSFASLRAQSDKVKREREPHLPKRPRGVRG